MVIVRYAVPAMDGNVHGVRPGDQAQTVDVEADLSIAGELVRLGAFDIRVRAVTADPVGAEQRDAEDEILQGLMRAHSHLNSKRLSRFEHVRGHPVAAHKLD